LLIAPDVSLFAGRAGFDFFAFAGRLMFLLHAGRSIRVSGSCRLLELPGSLCPEYGSRSVNR
jgi:hypothetical protein